MYALIGRLAAVAAAIGLSCSVPDARSHQTPASAGIDAAANAKTARSSPATGGRIALVPLDDRPACLQYPVMFAALADAEVVTPPRVVLGRFLKTGDGDAVARWLDALDPSGLDAVVVSADMVAYGGLVGSRVGRVFEADARRRIEAIGRLKQRRADLRVYVFSTIMRLAPTADGGNEAWREKVARWAEISPAAGTDDAARTETAELEAALPAGMLDRYRATRARNRAINLALIDLAATNAVDLLVFSQDDARPSGVHVADRLAIVDAIGKSGAKDRAVIQTGADEVGMLLVTRALLSRARHQPRVRVVYSAAAARERVMPFEDRPLGDTVAAHLTMAGALADRATAATQLFIYTSRFDSPDPADAFAAEAAKAAAAGARIIVADIDTKGEVQGAAVPFVEALRARKLVPQLAGYSSWNTAGNTIGTSLAHGLLAALGTEKIAAASREAAERIAAAQVHTLVHRFANDFLYQGVVRGQAVEDFLQPRRFNPLRLDDRARPRVEKHLMSEMRPLVESLLGDFGTQPWRLPTTGLRRPVALVVKDLELFELTLPWSRMFEAEILLRIALVTEQLAPKPPAPRVLQ